MRNRTFGSNIPLLVSICFYAFSIWCPVGKIRSMAELQVDNSVAKWISNADKSWICSIKSFQIWTSVIGTNCSLFLCEDFANWLSHLPTLEVVFDLIFCHVMSKNQEVMKIWTYFAIVLSVRVRSIYVCVRVRIILVEYLWPYGLAVSLRSGYVNAHPSAIEFWISWFLPPFFELHPSTIVPRFYNNYAWINVTCH